jgi:hypothetical protein
VLSSDGVTDELSFISKETANSPLQQFILNLHRAGSGWFIFADMFTPPPLDLMQHEDVYEQSPQQLGIQGRNLANILILFGLFYLYKSNKTK